MRIAFVGINYAPEPTGISVYTTGMAEYFASRGHGVTVYTGFPYYPLWSKSARDCGRWYRRERVNSVSVLRSYLYVPSRPTPLTRIFHELSFVISASIAYLLGSRADCTVIVSPPLFLGVPILLIAKLKRSRTIFHVQDLQPDAAIDLGMLKRGWLTKFLHFVERLTYRAADEVSTISEGMFNKIAAKGIDTRKIFLLRNWANDDQVVPLSKSTAFRRELGLEDKFVVLYSGNMGVKQGLHTLLDAARILDDTPEIAVVIAGGGGEKRALERKAAEMQLRNVAFLPVQPYDRLGELLATADVSVIPQKSGVNDIVLPSKLCNIMASQRPIIAAAPADSEFGRIVSESKGGLLVTPENPAQLADAIKHLYHNLDVRVQMAGNGRYYMESHLAHQAILDTFHRHLVAAPSADRPT
jgi:colanic acid biosynthesis glycosyl transferase WcaI